MFEFDFVEAKGEKLVRRCLKVESGVIVGTDQRSDTRVSGSGSSSVWNGYGSGYSQVGSTVTVNRDIYFKGVTGPEKHLRVYFDLPAREGQVVHLVSFANAGDESWQRYLIYNASLETWWWFVQNQSASVDSVFEKDLLPYLKRISALYDNEEATAEAVDAIEKEAVEKSEAGIAKETEAFAALEEAYRAAHISGKNELRKSLKTGLVVIGMGIVALAMLSQCNSSRSTYTPPSSVPQQPATPEPKRTDPRQEAAERERQAAAEQQAAAEKQAVQAEERARDAARKGFFGKWSGAYFCEGWQRDAPATLEVTENMLVITVALQQGQVAREEHRWSFDAATGLARFSNTMLKAEGDTILLRNIGLGNCTGKLYRSS